MRVVLWWPGVETSVNDVPRGIGAGLEANGVDVVPYYTGAHLEAAHGVLLSTWRRAKRNGATRPKPTAVDLYYYANYGLLERVARYQPDWVVMVSGFMQHWNYIGYMKQLGARVAFVCTESPYDLAGEVLIASLCVAVSAMQAEINADRQKTVKEAVAEGEELLVAEVKALRAEMARVAKLIEQRPG